MAHPDQWFGDKTYSQHGEDLFFLNAFKLLGIDKPTYIDIGAHHPFNISNTALLYERGSRGVNVEPNPNLFADFLKYRPEDVNLNVGVGTVAGDLNYYMIDQFSGRNTFSLSEAEAFVRENLGFIITEVRKIPVTTIDKVIEACPKPPNLITVDAEGFDLRIVQSLDILPDVICVEEKGNYSQFKEALPEYECLARLGSNLIFVPSWHVSRLR